MNADEFREIALSFPEAVEAGHFDHPDFRVGGKIFATLGWPDESWGVVKLTPDQQQEIIARDPVILPPDFELHIQLAQSEVRRHDIGDQRDDDAIPRFLSRQILRPRRFVQPPDEAEGRRRVVG